MNCPLLVLNHPHLLCVILSSVYVYFKYFDMRLKLKYLARLVYRKF